MSFCLIFQNLIYQLIIFSRYYKNIYIVVIKPSQLKWFQVFNRPSASDGDR